MCVSKRCEAQVSYDHDSGALCVTRERCEALCDSTPGCTGIEYHHTLPRCYLLQGQCTVEESRREPGALAALVSLTE